MLVSFLLVALPLMIGLMVLFFQMDRLSVQMQSIVNQSAAVMENSRLVTTQALGLKRSAEQYLILLDRKLLARYEEQRHSLQKSVEVLLELPIDMEMSNNLHQVARIEERLHSELNDIDATHALRADQEPNLLPEKPAELDQLAVLIGNIPTQAGEFVKSMREEMTASASRSKKSLVALLLTVVPTALFLALVSGTVINRPLKKVISLIKRMGEGEYPRDTYVGGPKDIEAMGEQLHWLSERLSQIEQQKVTFLQNVSHELKTPLTAIREGTDLMQEQVIGKLNPEQLEILEIMKQNTFLLQNQLESLLDFNLALTMDEPFPQVPVNIKLVIEKIIDKLHLILKSRQLSVEHNTPAARIIGNQAQLESLFENLLTNAIKFSPRGGTIKISTEVTNDGIDVEIQDAGPGFSNDEVKKVFKPFYQGRKSPNSHIKGTGLGLSIAKRYADLHGGRIEIANSAIGAAVKVLLPVNNMKVSHEA